MSMEHLICNTCDDRKPIDQFRTKLDKRDNRCYTVKKCKSCEAALQRARSQSAEGRSYHQNWKEQAKAKDPVKFMVQERISNWRRISASMGIQSDLTSEYLISLWNDQNGLCYYSGEVMKPNGGEKLNRPIPSSASLDKLNPHRGYVQGNVAWVTYRVNTSKGNLTEEEYYDYIESVLRVRDARACRPQP